MNRIITFTFEGQVGGVGEDAARSLANRLVVAAAVSHGELPTRRDLVGLALHLREVADQLARMGVEEPAAYPSGELTAIPDAFDDLPEGLGGARRCP